MKNLTQSSKLSTWKIKFCSSLFMFLKYMTERMKWFFLAQFSWWIKWNRSVTLAVQYAWWIRNQLTDVITQKWYTIVLKEDLIYILEGLIKRAVRGLILGFGFIFVVSRDFILQSNRRNKMINIALIIFRSLNMQYRNSLQ